MGKFDNERTVISIKNRIKGLGINLDQYIGEVTGKWDSVPMGFDFTCKNPAA